jgi:PAS domain S-box-containing protein
MCNPMDCRYLSQASRILLAVAPDGIIREVDRLNPTVLGRRCDALRGTALADLVAPGERKHVARALERCETGQPVWDEFHFLADDGRHLPALVCLQPMTGGEPTLLVTGIALDLGESAARTEAAAVLGRLAFRCHKPVHRLMQAVEDPTNEAACRCRDEVECLAEELSRYAAWPAPEVVADLPVDVVGVLEATLHLVDADPSYARLQVRLRPDDAAVWARAHPVGLAFVALHLIANARDASADVASPRLHIDIHPDQQRVVIDFADNGRGLLREDLSDCFSLCFSRGACDEDHTGLGLATCSEMVRFMGGSVRMQSRRGQGTIVSVVLPAADRPQ